MSIESNTRNQPEEGGRSTQKDSIDLWNQHAQWWQDEFTDGVDPEYAEQILPLIATSMQNCSRVLDVGTGEGQVARRLAEVGVDDIIGVDPIASQIALAVERSGLRTKYLRSTADRLPFVDASFDGAVACLVFEHLDDVVPAIAEISRVLQPEATFLLLLNHPLLQTPNSGWIDDQMLEPPEQYWRVGDYLKETQTIEEVQKGVFIRFVHRPLSRYINALAAADLSVIEMNEPAPPPGYLAQSDSFFAAAAIPRLLALRCRRGATPVGRGLVAD